MSASSAASDGGNFCGGFGDGAVAFAEFDFDGLRVVGSFQVLDVDVHIERGLAAQHVLWFRENIVDVGGGNDAEPDFAIDAAEGEVVDLIAEGRNVVALGGVEIDGQDIFAVEIDVRSQVERKRRVAAFVFA